MYMICCFLPKLLCEKQNAEMSGMHSVHLGNAYTLPRRKSFGKLAWHLHICAAYRLTFSLAIIQRVKLCPQSYCSRLAQSLT